MAIGDIGSVIDTLPYDSALGDMPSMCHVSGDVYAIASWGIGADGWLCTVEISSVGVMPATILDSWEWDVTWGSYPKIIKVYDTTFAIVYTDNAVAGILFTFNIANDGTITKSKIASGQFSAASANPHDLIKIDDNVFAVVFTDAAADGWIQTMGITNAGTISNLSLDTLEFDPVEGREGSLCHITAHVYAIAYRGPGDDGWLCTLTISDAGVISATVIDTLEFDTNTCVEPSIVKARDNYFAIAYRGPGADGWLKIIHIADNGTITDPPVDTYEFDLTECNYPSLFAMGEGYLALAYTRSGNHLYLYTFLVDAAGSLNSTTLDTQQITATATTWPQIIRVNSQYYAIVFVVAPTDTRLITISIESPAVPAGQHHLMTGML